MLNQTKLSNQSLSEETCENIQTKIMSVLYANIDTEFTQHNLYNKLLEDKYNKDRTTNYIDPNFKTKYLLVLSNLQEKYDDIRISITYNYDPLEQKPIIIYNIVCFSDESYFIGKQDIFETSPDLKQNLKQNLKPDLKQNYKFIFNKLNNLEYMDSHLNSDNKFTYELDYIIDNNLINDIGYIDFTNGNTIYHDLVISNNVDHVMKLIEQDKFDYIVKNKNNQTPLECSQNLQNSQNSIMTKCLVSGLTNKFIKDTTQYKLQISNLQTKIATLDNKIYFLETYATKKHILEIISIYDFIKFKFNQLYTNNKLIVWFIFGLILVRLYSKMYY